MMCRGKGVGGGEGRPGRSSEAGIDQANPPLHPSVIAPAERRRAVEDVANRQL